VLAAINGTTHENDRSWVYDYDALQRLIKARRGQLNSASTALETGGSAPVPQAISWALDNLGNWSGSPVTGSYRHWEDTSNDGQLDTGEAATVINHQVDASNRPDQQALPKP
jgi:hypothetical protein